VSIFFRATVCYSAVYAMTLYLSVCPSVRPSVCLPVHLEAPRLFAARYAVNRRFADRRSVRPMTSFCVKRWFLQVTIRLLPAEVKCPRDPNFGARECSAPAVWNSLPKTVVNSDSVTVFKSRLKTFLFPRAFSLPSSQQHTACPQSL